MLADVIISFARRHCISRRHMPTQFSPSHSTIRHFHYVADTISWIKKTGHLSQLRQMLIDFQNSFTDGPITRKHVATLLCETLMFKNLISTLINTSCSLSATSSETGLLYLQTSEAIWLYQGRRQGFRPGWAKLGAKRRKKFFVCPPWFSVCPPCHT